MWFIRQQHTSDILQYLFDIVVAYFARRSTMLLCISIAVAVLVQPLYTGGEQSLRVVNVLGTCILFLTTGWLFFAFLVIMNLRLHRRTAKVNQPLVRCKVHAFIA